MVRPPPPSDLTHREARRLALQQHFDTDRSATSRNQMGQFATPATLAQSIVQVALTYTSAPPRRMLDPGFGTGAFYSALIQHPGVKLHGALGFEVDPEYVERVGDLWRETGIELRGRDFTRAKVTSADRADLVLANPPYVRHHHLDRAAKLRLSRAAHAASGIELSGLSSLYAYFLCLAHPWMLPGAVAAWLLPAEFMKTRYGAGLRRYLTTQVQLERVHHFGETATLFDEALVGSAVVFFRNLPAPPDHVVELTTGQLPSPSAVQRVRVDALGTGKWSFDGPEDVRKSALTLGDLFEVRRGLVTGRNSFFVIERGQAERLDIPDTFLRPILPSPRRVPDLIEASDDGYPLLSPQHVLLNCRLDESDAQQTSPALWRYLQEGAALGVDRGYLCSRRRPWYVQEHRDPARLLCTYMGRGSGDSSPFRILLNRSEAIAPNVYLNLYPRERLRRATDADPELWDAIWRRLRSLEGSGQITRAGRTYGGGLHKVEPRELAGVDATVLGDLIR